MSLEIFAIWLGIVTGLLGTVALLLQYGWERVLKTTARIVGIVVGICIVWSLAAQAIRNSAGSSDELHEGVRHTTHYRGPSQGVVTIENKTRGELYYTLKVTSTDGSVLHSQNYTVKNGAFIVHNHSDAARFEIVFDHIYGDNEVTNKTYDLPFATIAANQAATYDSGTKYAFMFGSEPNTIDLFVSN